MKVSNLFLEVLSRYRFQTPTTPVLRTQPRKGCSPTRGLIHRTRTFLVRGKNRKSLYNGGRRTERIPTPPRRPDPRTRRSGRVSDRPEERFQTGRSSFHSFSFTSFSCRVSSRHRVRNNGRSAVACSESLGVCVTHSRRREGEGARGSRSFGAKPAAESPRYGRPWWSTMVSWILLVGSGPSSHTDPTSGVIHIAQKETQTLHH